MRETSKHPVASLLRLLIASLTGCSTGGGFLLFNAHLCLSRLALAG